MHDDCDVLVLGGGIAGAAAALAAAQQGARVLLVRAAPGATSLSIGAWRDLPPEPVRGALADVGFALHALHGPLPRPDGSLLSAVAAPLAHAIAAISADNAPDTLVCGIDGVAEFQPAALAALWADAGGVPDGALRAVSLSLDDTPAAGWSTVSLAALLERKPALLAGPLAAAASMHGAARVIVPAVLGLEQHGRVHAALEADTGVRVGEALGSSPSLPGWRLDLALRAALDVAGVRVIAARVVAHEQSRDRITAVTIAGDDGRRTIRAASQVLATGKFIGGGIAADVGFVETALGCAVALDRFDRIFDHAAESLLLTAELRTDPQPLLGIGVHCDEASNPVTVLGNVIYRNVFVAGSVRANVEAAAIGLGEAAADGWNAGVRAAACAATG